MREWIFAKAREWSVLGVGLIFVGGGLYAASSSQSQSNFANVAAVAEGQRSPGLGPQVQAPRAPTPARTADHDDPNRSAAETTPVDSSVNAPSAAPTTGNAAAQQRSVAPAAALAQHNHEMAEQPVAVVQNSRQAPAAPGASTPSPALTGDAAAGRLVFRKCQACHSLESGKNGLGPSLAGIVGKKAGTVANFNYSPAMKASNYAWDVAALDAYLSDPQKAIPGNRMPFPGLKTENERSTVIAYLGAAASSASVVTVPAVTERAPTATARGQSPPAAQSAATSTDQRGSSYIPGLRYTLRTGIAEGRMVYIGVGGAIDGQINPVLSAAEGQMVQVTLINGEGAEHDIVFADQKPTARSPHITGKGASTNIAFSAGKAGDYIYFCSLPGHQLAGMQGQFLVTPRPPAQTVVEADISQKSTDVPPPIGKRRAQNVRVDLVAVELEGRLAEGTTFGYWTFNGKVPGPFLRVRVGDTVDVHMKNSGDSSMIHSVDFHAVTGPGGGAAVTQANPGDEKTFKFKALIPGLYVYHCATPMVAHHIANGMYGLILVEPEGGLPPVDREFYVMQGEIYTEAAFGQHGSQEFNVEKLLNERPEYFVFNGSVGALSKLHPLEAKVGETVRIFFGVGGPNFTSSFHVIGEIFDRVYNLGGVLSDPIRGIQTVTVAPGGAVIAEFKLDVPGNYLLVDHALSRLERGLVGILHVEGQPNPEIFDGKVESGSGH
jgi:nitrite reductase (NO-forming)